MEFKVNYPIYVGKYLNMATLSGPHGHSLDVNK